MYTAESKGFKESLQEGRKESMRHNIADAKLYLGFAEITYISHYLSLLFPI